MPRPATAQSRSSNPTPTPKVLALQVLNAALADLHREARQAGREELYLQLRGGLTELPESRAHQHPEHRDAASALALKRLRQRFRERVNHHLRGVEQDAGKRRILRRQLRQALHEHVHPAREIGA